MGWSGELQPLEYMCMKKNRRGLDSYDRIPEEMEEYLRHNGYHFNRRAYEYACSFMEKRTGGSAEQIEPSSREEVAEMLKRYGMKLQHGIMYDAAYLYSMAMADFFGKSLPTEQTVAQWIKDCIDDVDQPDGYIFNRWYADMCYAGIPIDWDSLI